MHAKELTKINDTLMLQTQRDLSKDEQVRLDKRLAYVQRYITELAACHGRKEMDGIDMQTLNLIYAAITRLIP